MIPVLLYILKGFSMKSNQTLVKNRFFKTCVCCSHIKLCFVFLMQFSTKLALTDLYTIDLASLCVELCVELLFCRIFALMWTSMFFTMQALSQDGLKLRDRMVYEAISNTGDVPLVVTMGGGYPKNLNHTSNEFRSIVDTHANVYIGCIEHFHEK